MFRAAAVRAYLQPPWKPSAPQAVLLSKPEAGVLLWARKQQDLDSRPRRALRPSRGVRSPPSAGGGRAACPSPCSCCRPRRAPRAPPPWLAQPELWMSLRFFPSPPPPPRLLVVPSGSKKEKRCGVCLVQKHTDTRAPFCSNFVGLVKVSYFDTGLSLTFTKQLKESICISCLGFFLLALLPLCCKGNSTRNPLSCQIRFALKQNCQIGFPPEWKS